MAAGPDRWELRAGWTRTASVVAIVATLPADLPAPSAARVKVSVRRWRARRARPPRRRDPRVARRAGARHGRSGLRSDRAERRLSHHSAEVVLSPPARGARNAFMTIGHAIDTAIVSNIEPDAVGLAARDNHFAKHIRKIVIENINKTIERYLQLIRRSLNAHLVSSLANRPRVGEGGLRGGSAGSGTGASPGRRLRFSRAELDRVLVSG